MSALTETALYDLVRARAALDTIWPFLRNEEDLSDSDRGAAAKLEDLMTRESFYRELPSIDQHTKVLEDAYEELLHEASDECAGAYETALEHLRTTPGWEQVGEEQRDRIAEPLAAYGVAQAGNPSIPQLRADLDACSVRRDKAIEELLRVIDGSRIVKVSVSSYFAGGVETEEQLDQALEGLKEQCIELIGAGKKVLIQ